MIFLHIDPSKRDTELFNKYVSSGKQIFVLFYMEGCGPCNATRPEWSKIEGLLKKKYSHNNNIVIADVDQQLLSEIKNISGISGFPTMRYIADHGKTSEEYEKSSIREKNRSIDSFVEWIESKIKPYHLESKSAANHHVKHGNNKSTRKHHVKHGNNKSRGQKGGSSRRKSIWFRKYKYCTGISCKNKSKSKTRTRTKSKTKSKTRTRHY